MSLYVSQPFLSCSVTFLHGSDGAHSAMRQALGIEKIGDASDSNWGVMDVFRQTNFLDIRKQTIMQNLYRQ
ncbi:hypothetical protein ACSS6W_004889 [Trichoderma asperelloides]